MTTASGAAPEPSDIGTAASAAGGGALAAKSGNGHGQGARPGDDTREAPPEGGRPDHPGKEPGEAAPPADQAPETGSARGKGRSKNAGRGRKQDPIAAACTAADAQPAEIGIAAARGALLCAINATRSARGRAALAVNGRLEWVAQEHSVDMVRRRYFSHDTKRGHSWSERVRASGYTDGARSWRIGETLAWAGGSYTTARERVRAWLASKPHRKVMLNPVYREVGLGITFGTPQRGPGATFTADFGRVR